MYNKKHYHTKIIYIKYFKKKMWNKKRKIYKVF